MSDAEKEYLNTTPKPIEKIWNDAQKIHSFLDDPNATALLVALAESEGQALEKEDIQHIAENLRDFLIGIRDLNGINFPDINNEAWVNALKQSMLEKAFAKDDARRNKEYIVSSTLALIRAAANRAKS